MTLGLSVTPTPSCMTEDKSECDISMRKTHAMASCQILQIIELKGTKLFDSMSIQTKNGFKEIEFKR